MHDALGVAISLDTYAVQLLIGIASGSLLFLVASGLTLIFGAMRVVSFAHGSLYMLGAYAALWLTPAGGAGNAFWLVLLAAGLIVAGVGLVLELLVYRPIYRRPLVIQFLATFALIFVFAGILREFFGAGTRTVAIPDALSGSIGVLGARVPIFNFVFIAAALLVAFALWALLHRTNLGKLIRACVSDPELLGLAGVNVPRVFTGVFVLSAFFAGLAGAIVTLAGSASPALALDSIVRAFVVVIIGGLGSLRGAFAGAMLVGVAEALGILWVPEASLAIVFAVLVAVLAVRPHGLMGRAA